MDKKLVEKLEELNTEELMRLLVKKMGYEFSKENIIDEKSKDYIERKDRIVDKLNKKEIELSKNTKKNAIAIRYSNKILEFFRKIFSFNH